MRYDDNQPPRGVSWIRLIDYQVRKKARITTKLLPAYRNI
jgi:hypothetical protein